VFERAQSCRGDVQQAGLEEVQFIDCKLTGTDFRGDKLKTA
jgi:hypothetical protein